MTGTDTGVGKTLICREWVHAARRRGLRTRAMKPVASGARRTPEGLRNDDALALWDAAERNMSYAQVNPYCFEEPVSPHIAAGVAGEVVDLQVIAQIASRAQLDADWLVVEGVGGWLAPICGALTVRDLALRLALPVVIVVGLRLGCLNHAALTLESIKKAGLPLIGWIGNRIDPTMLRLEDNLASLATILGAPPLAILGWQPGERQLQQALDAAMDAAMDAARAAASC